MEESEPISLREAIKGSERASDLVLPPRVFPISTSWLSFCGKVCFLYFFNDGFSNLIVRDVFFLVGKIVHR